MILWFPSHISKDTVFVFLRDFDRTTFTQILQDRIHSRYPSFSQTKVVVDKNFEEIDIKCSVNVTDLNNELPNFYKKILVWGKAMMT